MSKADQFLLSDSEPDSPKHGSDAVGTASEAAASKPAAPVPPPPAPAAPAVEPPPPQQVTMELEAKGVKLTELYNKAIQSMSQLEDDLEAELKQTLADFRNKMAQLKEEMATYVDGEWKHSARTEQETAAIYEKLERFTDQLAMCVRRGGDVAMQG